MKVKYAIVIAGIVLAMTGCGKGQDAYNKAMKLAQEGKYEKATQYFKDAMKEDKERTEYYIGYGMTLNRMNRFQEAKEEFEKVTQETDNKISKENNKQVYYGLAVASYGLGQYQDVISYCNKALKISYLSDMDNDILYSRAVVRQLTGQNQKAQEDCNKIIKKDKKYTDAYTQLAALQKEAGQKEEAIKTYEKLIQLDKTDYDAYFDLYEQYLENNQTDAAEELLDQLIVLKPSNTKNMLTVGRAYYYKKDYEKAKEYFQMAQDGNSKESAYYLAQIAVLSKSYQDAAKYLESYLKNSGENKNPQAYHELAGVYMEMKQYKKAQKVVTKGIACGSTSAIQNLKKDQVIVYERQNEYEKALQAAKEFLKSYPNSSGMKRELEFIKTRIK